MQRKTGPEGVKYPLLIRAARGPRLRGVENIVRSVPVVALRAGQGDFQVGTGRSPLTASTSHHPPSLLKAALDVGFRPSSVPGLSVGRLRSETASCFSPKSIVTDHDLGQGGFCLSARTAEGGIRLRSETGVCFGSKSNATEERHEEVVFCFSARTAGSGIRLRIETASCFDSELNSTLSAPGCSRHSKTGPEGVKYPLRIRAARGPRLRGIENVVRSTPVVALRAGQGDFQVGTGRRPFTASTSHHPPSLLKAALDVGFLSSSAPGLSVGRLRSETASCFSPKSIVTVIETCYVKKDCEMWILQAKVRGLPESQWRDFPESFRDGLPEGFSFDEANGLLKALAGMNKSVEYRAVSRSQILVAPGLDVDSEDERGEVGPCQYCGNLTWLDSVSAPACECHHEILIREGV
jgi:hypothetical protein